MKNNVRAAFLLLLNVFIWTSLVSSKGYHAVMISETKNSLETREFNITRDHGLLLIFPPDKPETGVFLEKKVGGKYAVKNGILYLLQLSSAPSPLFYAFSQRKAKKLRIRKKINGEECFGTVFKTPKGRVIVWRNSRGEPRVVERVFLGKKLLIVLFPAEVERPNFSKTVKGAFLPLSPHVLRNLNRLAAKYRARVLKGDVETFPGSRVFSLLIKKGGQLFISYSGEPKVLSRNKFEKLNKFLLRPLEERPSGGNPEENSEDLEKLLELLFSELENHYHPTPPSPDFHFPEP